MSVWRIASTFNPLKTPNSKGHNSIYPIRNHHDSALSL
jgi:hypothetical protein